MSCENNLRRHILKLISFVCWCLIVCVPLAAWPQSQAVQPSDAQSAKVKNEVRKLGSGERARVKVTLRDKTEVKGYISQIGTDSFQVTDKKSGRSTPIAYQEVDKVRKRGLSTGAKIAILAGTGVGIVVIAALAQLSASGE